MAIVKILRPEEYIDTPDADTGYAPSMAFYTQDFYRWQKDRIYGLNQRVFLLDLYIEIKGDDTSTVEEMLVNAIVEAMNYFHNNPPEHFTSDDFPNRTLEYYYINTAKPELGYDYLKIKTDYTKIQSIVKDKYIGGIIDTDTYDRLTDAVVVKVNDGWVAFYWEVPNNFFDPQAPVSVFQQRPRFDNLDTLDYLYCGYASTAYFDTTIYTGTAVLYGTVDDDLVVDGGEASTPEYDYLYS